MRLRSRTVDVEESLPKKREYKKMTVTIQDEQFEAPTNGSETRANAEVPGASGPAAGSNDVDDPLESQCALLNNDVLEHLFSFLDLDSLASCRLVSKAWNEGASRLMGHKSWLKVNWQKIHQKRAVFSPSENREARLTKYEREEKGKTETVELLRCLSGLYNSSVFVNFEFDIEWLTNEEFQELLEKLGSGLRRIIIRDRKPYRYDEPDVQYFTRMDIVFNILTKWCPKLRSFQMEVVRVKIGPTPPAQIKSLERLKPMIIQEINIEGELTKYQSLFWIQLIKACPDLTSLRISCTPEQPYQNLPRKSKRSLRCEWFFEQISKLPEVTRKLQEFSWNGTWKRAFRYKDIYPTTFSYVKATECTILESVANIEFSNKLKKIGIGPSVDSLNGNQLCFTLLLKKLNACGTQEIVLNGNYKRPPMLPVQKIRELYGGGNCNCNGGNHKVECLSRIDHIPEMPKVTSIKSFAEDNYLLGCFRFVQKFPNLLTLDMSPNYNRDYPRADNFAPELDYICQIPHFKLRKLIVNPPVIKAQTLECIIESFPNLTSLKFDVGHSSYDRGWFSPPPNKISFKKALIIASKCKHLEELTVSFMSVYTLKDLCEALGVVKNFPNLKFLTLNAVHCQSKISLQYIEPGLSQLLNLPTSVCLVGFKVTTTTPKIIPIIESIAKKIRFGWNFFRM